MSPEYNGVYVPVAAAENFEVFLAENGGSFKNKRDPDDVLKLLDPHTLWERDQSSAKSLIAQARTNFQNPELRARFFNQGQRMLVEAAATQPFFEGYSLSDKILHRIAGEPEYLEQALTATLDLFDQQTPGDMPKTARLQKNQGKPHLIRESGPRHPAVPTSILPMEISLLIKKYGLADGVAQTLRNQMEALQLTPNTASTMLRNVRKFVRVNVLEKS